MGVRWQRPVATTLDSGWRKRLEEERSLMVVSLSYAIVPCPNLSKGCATQHTQKMV